MTEVLIVGAGPTGLMAALLLDQCGIKFRILDQAEQQAHESRAFVLQARSMELFLNLGIVDHFLERGVIAPGVELFVNGRQKVEVNLNDIGTKESPYAFLLMLPQSKVEKILIAELGRRGIQVEHKMTVTDFSEDLDSVAVSVINDKGQEQKIRCAYILGADGAHSIVRKQLGLKFEGGAYSQNFMLADCRIDWPLDYSFVKIFFRKNFLGVYFPLKDKNLGRVVTISYGTTVADKSEKSPSGAEAISLAEVEKSFQAAVGLPLTLANPLWTTRYHIHHRGVNHYRKGRAFLAGDAAHIHSPVGAQGMNTGLQDVANLVWKLALVMKGAAPERLLNTYHEERYPIGQKLLHFTDNFFAKVASQNRVTGTLRNFLFPLLMKMITKIPCLKFRAFRFVSQLGIHYHQNRFLRDDWTKGAPLLRPGQRAPNASYKRNHDVFGLIKGYRFHLLALSRQSLSQEEIGQISKDLSTLPSKLSLPLQTHFIAHSLGGYNPEIIQAESNKIFEIYGLSEKNPQALFLIRPDGYIAYRCNQLKLERLIKYWNCS